MKNGLLASFKKSIEKFGAVKVLAIALVTAFVIGGLIVQDVSKNMQKTKFDGLIASAQEKFEAGLYDQAFELVREAKDVLPNGDDVINTLNRDISIAKSSSEAFSEASLAIQDQNYAEALKAFSRVLKATPDLYEEAQSKAKEIRPLVIKNALVASKVQAGQGNYIEAASILGQAKAVAGSTPALDKAKASYEKTAKNQAKQLRTAAVSKMQSKKDSFSEITWYRDRSSPVYTNRNGFFLYFGAESGSKMILRLRIQYFDDDWLFIDSARINVDGEIYNLTGYEWERDNDSSIWEWIDEPLDDREMIEAIIKSKKAVIRFDGDQYYDTRTISQAQKTALKNVLRAFDYY